MRTIRIKTAWLDNADPELKRAWATFADPVQENHGERLQYMGSELSESGWHHCFRHRSSPESNERKYHHIPALDGWNPELR